MVSEDAIFRLIGRTGMLEILRTLIQNDDWTTHYRIRKENSTVSNNSSYFRIQLEKLYDMGIIEMADSPYGTNLIKVYRMNRDNEIANALIDLFRGIGLVETKIKI